MAVIFDTESQSILIVEKGCYGVSPDLGRITLTVTIHSDSGKGLLPECDRTKYYAEDMSQSILIVEKGCYES